MFTELKGSQIRKFVDVRGVEHMLHIGAEKGVKYQSHVLGSAHLCVVPKKALPHPLDSTRSGLSASIAYQSVFIQNL